MLSSTPYNLEKTEHGYKIFRHNNLVSSGVIGDISAALKAVWVMEGRPDGVMFRYQNGFVVKDTLDTAA